MECAFNLICLIIILEVDYNTRRSGYFLNKVGNNALSTRKRFLKLQENVEKSMCWVNSLLL